MAKCYEGILVGKGLKFGVVVSRFNEIITTRLLEGMKDALLRHGVGEGDIDVAWTPGCLEIPLIAKKLAQSGKYDAIICLGAVNHSGEGYPQEGICDVNKAIRQEHGIPPGVLPTLWEVTIYPWKLHKSTRGSGVTGNESCSRLGEHQCLCFLKFKIKL